MPEVEKNDKRIKDYLMNIGCERWSTTYSTVNRTLTMTSNIAQSINATLKAAREILAFAGVHKARICEQFLRICKECLGQPRFAFAITRSHLRKASVRICEQSFAFAMGAGEGDS
uniref:Uncharacterized protein n=1 Tax=Nicotiana tabacum TaxID=4097 RepID=A0A1S4DJQ1_TOBAC|nr:PREDICTED: uncharacterized protein LOC107830544 [Nicotiana tabacum]